MTIPENYLPPAVSLRDGCCASSHTGPCSYHALAEAPEAAPPPEPPDDDPDAGEAALSLVREDDSLAVSVHEMWQHGSIGDEFHARHCVSCRPLRGRHRKPPAAEDAGDGFPAGDGFTACWVAVMNDGITGVFADPEDAAAHSEKYGSVITPVPYYARGGFRA